MTSPTSVTAPRPKRRNQARLRHDMAQALGAMSALLGVIEANPLHAVTVLPRLEQLRVQTEWMAAILEEVGHPRPCDVGEVVAETWTAEGRYALCTVQLRREQVPPAIVDPANLRRTVRNLLDNAIRAAGVFGRVEIAVSTVEGRILVEVDDDGPGFGRIPSQSGLGLATARTFAASSGGRLTVGKSALGGTAMLLELPALQVRTVGKAVHSA